MCFVCVTEFICLSIFCFRNIFLRRENISCSMQSENSEPSKIILQMIFVCVCVFVLSYFCPCARMFGQCEIVQLGLSGRVARILGIHHL